VEVDGSGEGEGSEEEKKEKREKNFFPLGNRRIGPEIGLFPSSSDSTLQFFFIYLPFLIPMSDWARWFMEGCSKEGDKVRVAEAPKRSETTPTKKRKDLEPEGVGYKWSVFFAEGVSKGSGIGKKRTPTATQRFRAIEKENRFLKIQVQSLTKRCEQLQESVSMQHHLLGNLHSSKLSEVKNLLQDSKFRELETRRKEGSTSNLTRVSEVHPIHFPKHLFR
jgi:hypothetical protein